MNGYGPSHGPSYGSEPLADRQVALIDLLDRLLSGGVVLTGDVVLSIADIDLVRISLRALVVSFRSGDESPFAGALTPRDGDADAG
ncbi:gas vesicle protein [Streptomyces tropicalis]|uniref:Gas vesicle protein n=1 Tax=Streptomyces tropicalis TaxID=3034234 RepID=A0ABT6A379_9ACTN|nr:gas vesicle protein [Streptomyces tropicalis]MDF3298836.1 gas vesicle protein [Streptomyces tropicalis]